MTHLSCNVAFNAVTLGTQCPCKEAENHHDHIQHAAADRYGPHRHALPGRDHRLQGRLLRRVGRPDARGYRGRVRGGAVPPGRRGRPRAEPVVRRDPPEQMRGFVDLVDHPWVREVCTAVLGPDYEIVELGFDIPFAGRDDSRGTGTSPRRPRPGSHRLTSLAFNLTAVDTGEDMGPFEIAPGTQ